VTSVRVLHLFANYKWTGPADPAIRTAARLRQQGLDLAFAQAAWMHRGGEHRVAEELQRWRVPAVTGLELKKHFHAVSLIRDVRALRGLLLRDGYGVVHCHQAADHLIAALAVCSMAQPPVLVRTFYEPDPGALTSRERWCLRRTAGAVVPGPAWAATLGDHRAAVLVQEPVTEPRETKGPDLRAAWGLGSEHLLVGITARIQPHRRFGLLWQTAARVIARLPQARFVLLGRGNERDTEEQVRAPLRALGLADRVVLPGYLREPEYSAALRSFDAFLFLVPGSDGTCRAVREAMAAGLPVVATARGILPELVRARRGEATPGAICDETPESLGDALVTLLGDRERRMAAGEAARERARADMDPVAAARALAAFYTWLLAGRARDPEGVAVDRWWQQFQSGDSGLPAGVETVRGRIVRAVGRAALPAGIVFLKGMAFPRLKDKLRYLLRPLPAAHEARMLAVLAASGIPAPHVVAVRTVRRGLLPHRSLLVLRGLPVDHGVPPSLAERSALAAALCRAGIAHPDLNADNFVRLQDGSVAVLDLQSARIRGGSAMQRNRLLAAARLWSETGGSADAAVLVQSGLIRQGELAAVQDLALRLKHRWLHSRIARCLQESTEFQRRIRWRGIEHCRRGPRPDGVWLRGGHELVRAWIGERALEVLTGRPPCLLALFRTWPWLPGAHSVYIPAPFTESSFRAELPALREGFTAYVGLLRHDAAALPGSGSAVPEDGDAG
jgi:glycosyltransferase involved in cell wall biosynthesis